MPCSLKDSLASSNCVRQRQFQMFMSRLQSNIFLNSRKSRPVAANSLWLMSQPHHVLNSETQAHCSIFSLLSLQWLSSLWSKMLLEFLPSIYHSNRYIFIKPSILVQGNRCIFRILLDSNLLIPSNGSSDSKTSYSLSLLVYLGVCPLSWQRGQKTVS